MLKSILSGTIVLLAGSALAIAAPKDDVTAAAKKVADSNNYSWKQTTDNGGGPGGAGGQGGRRQGGQGGQAGQGGQGRQGRGGGGAFGGGPQEGMMAEGYVVTKMQRGDQTTEIIRKGEKVVIKGQDGMWMTPEEMAAAADNNGNGGNGGRRGGRGMMGAQRSPGEVASNLVSQTKDLTKSGDAYTGDLTEEGAKSLMTFGGRGGNNAPEISGAKGTAKFWVNNGMLTKFEYHVEGTMNRGGNDVETKRTTTYEIKDVGSTKVDVPEEAKKKLS